MNATLYAQPTTRWRIVRAVVREFLAYRRFRRLDNAGRDVSSIPAGFIATILDLGPAFVKLGQILSTRPDILPREYVRSLERLQEHVPPFDFDTVRGILEEELGRPLEEMFPVFERQPIASASLSQVHFAQSVSGDPVAVKVRRPDLEKRIRRDLNHIEKLASILRMLNSRLYRNLNLKATLLEFRRYTLQELDFSVEGRTYDRFRANFDGNPKVRFPRVYGDLTTDKVLTMERVSGLRLSEVEQRIPTEKRRELNTNVIATLIKMFVNDGFFHADLHPGNIFFGEDGSITLIDVGMFGELTPEQRERFILYWLAVVSREKRRAFHHLLSLTRRAERSDESEFYRHYSDLLDDFYNSNIREKSLTRTYLQILIGGARYGFVFPSEMLLQAKALTTAEYIGYVLVPDFNFSETAEPIIAAAFSDRLSLENLAGRISMSFPEYFLLGESAVPEPLTAHRANNATWEKAGEHIARKWDRLRDGDHTEVRHGEYAVEIALDAATVFNFVTRFARYPFWHPTYTNDSRVIHVSGDYVFITPDAVGSVFRLDEIIDGYHLLSNGVITEFERNALFKWKAPFSMLPLIEIGTCIRVDVIGERRTRLSEYFFFSDSPLKYVFVSRKWFSKEALTAHIREELTGVKTILESGSFDPEDVELLWEGIATPVRFVDGRRYLCGDRHTTLRSTSTLPPSKNIA